ncbi:MAG: NAAT family transporter [Acidimicrobiia bacterium]|nr:NAAT family transporter [Acidimicrobiia bacterium]
MDDRRTMVFAQVFVTLLVIMDPVGNVPIFLALTRSDGDHARRRAALQATVAAAAIILTFAAFGQQILGLLGISLQALQVSGGLLLVLVALELLQGGTGAGAAAEEGMNVALVPLGTPLLAGPGAIAATMVYMRDAGSASEVAVVVGALVTVLAVVYVVLRLAARISDVLTTNGILLLSRVVGLLVAAIAVELVATGIQEWARQGV